MTKGNSINLTWEELRAIASGCYTHADGLVEEWALKVLNYTMNENSGKRGIIPIIEEGKMNYRDAFSRTQNSLSWLDKNMGILADMLIESNPDPKRVGNQIKKYLSKIRDDFNLESRIDE